MTKKQTIDRIARECAASKPSSRASNLQTAELNNPATQMLQINNVRNISRALQAAYDAGAQARK